MDDKEFANMVEVTTILKNVLSGYRETVRCEWGKDIYKDPYYPEVNAALKWLKDNNIEIDESEDD